MAKLKFNKIKSPMLDRLAKREEQDPNALTDRELLLLARVHKLFEAYRPSRSVWNVLAGVDDDSPGLRRVADYIHARWGTRPK
jgi:hypothetical protein